MPDNIAATEMELMRIFSDDFIFEIPPYQRPYDWTQEETEDLVADLETAMGECTDVTQVPPYFLGSIVLIKSPDEPNAEVVDGQQRLTTLTIMFSVLRELIDDAYKSNVDRYIREKGDRFAGTSDQYRVKLRDRDRQFFADNVQDDKRLRGFISGSEPTSDSRLLMRDNAKHLLDRLSSFSSAKRDRFTSFLVRRCYLVVVTTTDKNAAYRVFSVMNTRGRNLSPTDIFKAQIIGPMEPDERDRCTEEWENIEENMGRDSFREVFQHVYMIKQRRRPPQGLEQGYTDDILPTYSGNEFIESVLAPYSDAYQIVTESGILGNPSADDINRILANLRLLDNADWIPVAMECVKLWIEDLSILTSILRDVERLAYALFVLRTWRDKRISRWARVLQELDAGKDLTRDESPLQLEIGERGEVITALNGTIPKVARKALLLRLDGLRAGEGAEYSHKIISVEHVLPVNPDANSQWMIDFPDLAIRLDWTNRLANLLLLSIRRNASANNRDFDVKKGEYFKNGNVTPFAITTEIIDEPEWTIEALERRQKDIVERLAQDWRL